MLKEYKKILEENNLTGKEMSNLLGLTHKSYRTLIASSVKVVPKWVKSFLIGYKLGKNCNDKK